MKKYELLENDSIIIDERQLYRIKALVNIETDTVNIMIGDLGGYIESEYNLSHDGNCWIYPDSYVYGSSEVAHNAVVSACKICNSKIFHETYIDNYTVINSIIGTTSEITSNMRGVYIENCNINRSAEIYNSYLRNVFIDGNVIIEESTLDGYKNHSEKYSIGIVPFMDGEVGKSLICIKNMTIMGDAEIHSNKDLGYISNIGLSMGINFYHSQREGVIICNFKNYYNYRYKGIPNTHQTIDTFKNSEEYLSLPEDIQESIIKILNYVAMRYQN